MALPLPLPRNASEPRFVDDALRLAVDARLRRRRLRWPRSPCAGSIPGGGLRAGPIAARHRREPAPPCSAELVAGEIPISAACRDILPALFRAAAELFARLHGVGVLPLAVTCLLRRGVAILRAFAMLGVVLPFGLGAAADTARAAAYTTGAAPTAASSADPADPADAAGSADPTRSADSADTTDTTHAAATDRCR